MYSTRNMLPITEKFCIWSESSRKGTGKRDFVGELSENHEVKTAIRKMKKQ